MKIPSPETIAAFEAAGNHTMEELRARLARNRAAYPDKAKTVEVLSASIARSVVDGVIAEDQALCILEYVAEEMVKAYPQ